MSKRLRDLVDFSLLDRLGKRHVACGPRSVAPEDYCAVVDWLFEVCLDMQLEDSTFVLAAQLFARFLVGQNV